jgi:ABC-type sugar transport system permease subunit
MALQSPGAQPYGLAQPSSPAQPSSLRGSDGMARIIGAVLLLPAVLAWVWSYLLPTITTVVRSFQRYNLLSPPQSVGTRNYSLVFGHLLDGGLGFGLRLAVLPLVVGVVVAPLLAVFAHRGGRLARRVTMALTAAPLVCFAPVAVTMGWWADRIGRTDLATPDAARTTLTSVVAWTSVGLVVAAGTTLALAAMRGRRPAVGLAAVGAVVALGVLAGGLQVYTAPAVLTGGGPQASTVTPVILVERGFASLSLGFTAAWSTVLLVILAVLGLAAVAVLLAVRARVEYVPARDTTADTTPTNRLVPLVVTGVLLLGLVVVVGYALAPWFGKMLGGVPLASSTSSSRLLINTWLPPLVSAIVGVFVALLGGIGIGALRPLGARSELLLLLFAPWLFVGTGPLAVADYERARSWHQVDTFFGLIPPSWLSIPALVLFTLLFRGLSAQWRAAGARFDRVGTAIALPALPMLGGAVVLVWLAGAQQLLWPELIANSPRSATAGIELLREQIGAYVVDLRHHSSAAGLVYPLPLLLVFVLGFVALGIWYLDRLAIQVGAEPPVPVANHPAYPMAAGPGTVPPAAQWIGVGDQTPGGQPLGSQPFGGPPFGGQTPGGPPFGGQTPGGQPFGGRPWGG